MSQGGTKTVFMIPQIVRPDSNYLHLVHCASEVTLVLLHISHVIEWTNKGLCL